MSEKIVHERTMKVEQAVRDLVARDRYDNSKHYFVAGDLEKIDPSLGPPITRKHIPKLIEQSPLPGNPEIDVQIYTERNNSSRYVAEILP